jgi:hypothetical protein
MCVFVKLMYIFLFNFLINKMDMSIYATYTKGYQGYIPKIQREEVVNRIQHSKHIPGYQGFISSVKAENKFGDSYGKVTALSLAKSIPKGSDVPPYSRYTSTMRESFVNQRNVKTMSTAELLGVTSRKDTYKKPIPIDTINKFFGIEPKHTNDEVLQKQSLDHNYDNFWSFVESNQIDYNERPPEGYQESNNAFWGIGKTVQEVHPGIFNITI